MNCSTDSRRAECSNNGYYCDDPASPGCICDENWTSYGLMSTKIGSNCDIDLHATEIAFYVSIFITFLCALVIIRYLVIRCLIEKSFWTQITTKDSKSFFPLMFLFAQIFLIAFDILVVIYKDKRIVGMNPGISVCVSFALFFCQIGLASYFLIVLKFLKSYASASAAADRDEIDKINRRFYQLYIVAHFLPPISFILCIMPLISLRYTSSNSRFMRTVLIGNGTMAIFFGILMSNVLGFVLKVLKDHLKSVKQSGQIRIVYKRLRRALIVIRIWSFIVGSGLILVGALDYLLRRSTYFVVFVALVLPPGSLVLIVTVSRMPEVREDTHLYDDSNIVAYDQTDRNVDINCNTSSGEAKVTAIA